MASEQDAARDRVLAARAAFDEEVGQLEASGRHAVDIPARVREEPAKAAAIAAGVGFVVLRGPQRLYRAARKAIFGTPAPMPKRMLPKEIEKTLKSMGDDGERVRGTLERDFADYVKKTEKDRKGLLSVVVVGLARPVLTRAVKRAGEYLFSPSPGGYSTGIDEVRARAGARLGQARASAAQAGDAARRRAGSTADAAKERVDGVRGRAETDAEGESPTGI